MNRRFSLWGLGETHSVACATEFERANKRASFMITNSFQGCTVMHYILNYIRNKEGKILTPSVESLKKEKKSLLLHTFAGVCCLGVLANNTLDPQSPAESQDYKTSNSYVLLIVYKCYTRKVILNTTVHSYSGYFSCIIFETCNY